MRKAIVRDAGGSWAALAETTAGTTGTMVGTMGGGMAVWAMEGGTAIGAGTEAGAAGFDALGSSCVP